LHTVRYLNNLEISSEEYEKKPKGSPEKISSLEDAKNTSNQEENKKSIGNTNETLIYLNTIIFFYEI
jgi:hypothetical protein